MQALQKRHIKPGYEYDKLFPKSSRQDTVIKGAGKAKLHHTINLMRDMVYETKGDTKLLAQILKGKNLEETCRNIWNFVYNHIRYRRDKKGVEQVRRPARTWVERKRGVDCDCYTVFISCILTNLDIPHSIRMTKYKENRFQHIYPVVPKNGRLKKEPLPLEHLPNNGWQKESGYITIDCVTDYFDYEVPFSDYRDFDMQSRIPVGEIHGLAMAAVSGVDSAGLIDDLGIFSLKQPALPLRESTENEPGASGRKNTPTCRLIIKTVLKEEDTLKPPKLIITKPDTTAEEPNESHQPEHPGISPDQASRAVQSSAGFWIKLLLAAGAGYGAYKLFEFRN